MLKKTPFDTDGFHDDESQKTSFDEDPIGYKLSCHVVHNILKQLVMTRALTYVYIYIHIHIYIIMTFLFVIVTIIIYYHAITFIEKP